MSSATMLGSDAHLPRQIRSPARRIETAVSFIDTSRPIYSSMAVLHSMLGPGVHVVSPLFHPIGEQPLILRGDSLPRLPHVDGSSTGTRVPRIGRRLRLPRFGGAAYADNFDDRSGYCEIGLPSARR